MKYVRISAQALIDYKTFVLRIDILSIYRIRQNVRGGKLSRFSRILAKRECFTIETFPASQLENNYRDYHMAWSITS